MHDAQLLKGVLEGCVSKVIERGKTYGYEILARKMAISYEIIIKFL